MTPNQGHPGADSTYGAADFHPGAGVYSVDGVHVGNLHRIVVDADTWDLHELIVEETRRFSGHLFTPGVALMTADIIVPMDAVEGVRHERVDLVLDAAAVRRLPPYLSYGYAPLTTGDVGHMVAALAGGAPYAKPLVETAAKTPDELEINPGESVMLGHTGQCLGRVRDVLFDGRELVGVVIRPEGFFKEDVILQVRFLERSDDAALFAHLRPEDIEHLTPFHPEGRA
jgi:sporulation protein YlmC with PRC-barrel domain